MKALILSCNTGQGHNTAGRAMLEHLQERNIPCEMKDALLFASERVSRVVSGSYINVATKAPQFFHFLYWAGGGISSSRIKSVVYLANKGYAKALGTYIEENGFDTVLLPHLFPAEALTSLRRKGNLSARCYAIATDYTCIPFWEETELDGYFIPHEDLRDEFVKKGIPEEKLFATGIPVSKRFCRPVEAAGVRKDLQIPADGKMLLVMSGSMGFGAVSNLTEKLAGICHPADRIFVLGGSNEPLKRELRQKFGADPRIKVLDFTDQVPAYMGACDVLFTKPGGLTSTEAAARNVPLIHTAPIPGCETINAAFFSSRGMSFCAKDESEAVACAKRLLADQEACEKMKAAQRREIHADAGDRICDFLLKG